MLLNTLAEPLCDELVFVCDDKCTADDLYAAVHLCARKLHVIGSPNMLTDISVKGSSPFTLFGNVLDVLERRKNVCDDDDDAVSVKEALFALDTLEACNETLY